MFFKTASKVFSGFHWIRKKKVYREKKGKFVVIMCESELLVLNLQVVCNYGVIQFPPEVETIAFDYNLFVENV